ncbi:MAG: T9SS type A sorting domain-containing protein [Paludibacteraceae bacterium]|nr:T9SS type A sorting domain-containing protein [Paludibacteraceae bacterium]
MQLTNIHGVIIESVGNSNVINASNLAKGIYILSVVSRNGTTDTIKLLKP